MIRGTIKRKNPEKIRFIHQTISPKLSKPKPGETSIPHLDALAKEVEAAPEKMLAFPPIEIFSIHDPETNEKVYYSLNNRKLYIAKKGHAPEINTTKATFAEILDSLWKMTSQSDGLNFPHRTHESNKTCEPTGLLLQFRNFITEQKEKHSPTQQGRQELYEETLAKFDINCKF